MNRLFVEITSHDGGKIDNGTLAILLIAMGKDISFQDPGLAKKSLSDRKVLLTTDVHGLRAELIAAPTVGGHA